jgi:hypothetical protein
MKELYNGRREGERESEGTADMKNQVKGEK